MNYTKTILPGAIICEPKILGDNRGYFFEAFKQESFEEFLGHKVNFIQDNESMSKQNVLRGLHFQKGHYSQSKLVRVTQGEVLDIAVDLRKESPTFKQYIAVVLSAENKKQLFVPKGFAHGFVVLSDFAVFNYKVDAPYNFESEVGMMFNDPEINIDWKIDLNKAVLSEKDTKQPLLSEIESELFDYNIDYYA